jgi:nucleoid-associated protein YgaU
VTSRAEVPFEIAEELPPGPTVATGAGSAAVGSGTALEARIGQTETMIIRRGDNLWRIARRLYGRGVRYSTIYEANTDQIGDPDRIYPGQVFVIPKGDRGWDEEAAATPQ